MQELNGVAQDDLGIPIDGKSFIQNFGGTGNIGNSCYFHSVIRLFLSNPIYRNILQKLPNGGEWKAFQENDEFCNTNTNQLLDDNKTNIGWQKFFVTLRLLLDNSDPNDFRRLRNAFCKLNGYKNKFVPGAQADASEAFVIITDKFEEMIKRLNWLKNQYHKIIVSKEKQFTTLPDFTLTNTEYNPVNSTVHEADNIIGESCSAKECLLPNNNKKCGNIKFLHKRYADVVCFNNFLSAKRGADNSTVDTERIFTINGQKKVISAIKNSRVSDIREIEIGGEVYRLTSFIKHAGGEDGGHWIAYSYNDLENINNPGSMTLFSDGSVSLADDSLTDVSHITSAIYVKKSAIANHKIDFGTLKQDPPQYNQQFVDNNIDNEKKNDIYNALVELEREKIYSLKLIIDAIRSKDNLSDEVKAELNKLPNFFKEKDKMPSIKLKEDAVNVYNEDDDVFFLMNRQKILKTYIIINSIISKVISGKCKYYYPIMNMYVDKAPNALLENIIDKVIDISDSKEVYNHNYDLKEFYMPILEKLNVVVKTPNNNIAEQNLSGNASHSDIITGIDSPNINIAGNNFNKISNFYKKKNYNKSNSLSVNKSIGNGKKEILIEENDDDLDDEKNSPEKKEIPKKPKNIGKEEKKKDKPKTVSFKVQKNKDAKLKKKKLLPTINKEDHDDAAGITKDNKRDVSNENVDNNQELLIKNKDKDKRPEIKPLKMFFYVLLCFILIGFYLIYKEKQKQKEWDRQHQNINNSGNNLQNTNSINGNNKSIQ